MLKTACVYYPKRLVLPGRLPVEPVPRDPGEIFDNSTPLPYDPVKQSGLAYVWSSYNCYYGLSHYLPVIFEKDGETYY
jgi:hypothetical protein